MRSLLIYKLCQKVEWRSVFILNDQVGHIQHIPCDTCDLFTSLAN